MHHRWWARLVWITLSLAVDSASPQIFVQDIPIAGIASVRALGHTPSRTSSALSSSTEGFSDESSSSTNSSSSSSNSNSNNSSSTSAITTEEELIDALEVDAQVTVVGKVQVGELACYSLAGAENASRLQIALSADEVVLAERSSYTVVSGDAFTDGLWRHVWKGLVNESANAGNESFARAVSMTWGQVCDVETFLLKVTTHHTNGNTSMVKSIPCAVSGTTICVVEVDLVFFEEQEPLTAPFNVSADDTFPGRRRLHDETDRGERRVRNDGLSGARANLSRRRQLQSSCNSTQIDIMMLYTDLALVQLGDVSAAQMESTITEGLVTTNAAFENSEVSIEFSLVYVGQLPYDQDPDMSSYEVLYELLDNSEVADLRDAYGADLVQLVGAFTDVCGLGYLYNSYWGAELGFSLVAPGCIEYDSHTHEFGHNMGCNHDYDSSTTKTEYGHGWRYCDGTDPYRTVMSYWCGSSRANYFSNPDVSYLDKPTGTASADNVRVLEDNMVAVSNFRDTVTLAPSSTPCSNINNPGPPSTAGIITFLTPSPTPGPWSAPTSDGRRAVHTERNRWGSVVVVILLTGIVAASCAALL